MEKFNNTTLFTGYLKQLLHNYNLPKYKVYTKQNAKYFEEHKEESKEILRTITKSDSHYPSNLHYIPYIKNGQIQEYIDGKWVRVGFREINTNKHIHTYVENIRIANYTKNLQIRNNIYDSYTHEYLGDFLRFQRDYNDIDLMPLYNCFSDRACDSLDLKWPSIKIDPETNEVTKTKIIFNTNDQKYKIYMLPIKLFKSYTIAIDCETPIELCCGLYGAYQDTRDKFAAIPAKTYQKITGSKFSAPFLYTKLADYCNSDDLSYNMLTELAQNESDFKLFIKVPQNNSSTIVVLEGDYRNWNDAKVEFKDITAPNGTTVNHALNITTNSVALNFEHAKDLTDVPLITPLQLLSFNTGKQHPFADRLIEYLMGNAIVPTDETAQNIKRVQKAFVLGTINNKDYNYEPENRGFWDEELRYIAYDYINNHITDRSENHDILGYIDKTVEKNYVYEINSDKDKISLSNTELTEEDL